MRWHYNKINSFNYVPNKSMRRRQEPNAVGRVLNTVISPHYPGMGTQAPRFTFARYNKTSLNPSLLSFWLLQYRAPHSWSHSIFKSSDCESSSRGGRRNPHLGEILSVSWWIESVVIQPYSVGSAQWGIEPFGKWLEIEISVGLWKATVILNYVFWILKLKY